MTGNITILSSSSSGKHTNYISSIFASPKLFVGFSPKAFSSDSETAMNSISSIADAKPFSVINNSFFSGRLIHKKPFFNNGDSVGLAIVDSLSRTTNQSARMVLLGSRLKIKIPCLQTNSACPAAGSVESPRTPIEFGVKNKNSKLALQSPAGGLMPKLFTGSMSPTEMELSEDYTCVISYGPNPKKTHIFDNYVVESCGNGFTASRKEAGFSEERRPWRSSEDFLSFCHGCRKRLGQGKDIFMYRGERAFCSDECRQIEMMSDDSDECIDNCFQDLPDHSK